MDNSLEKFIRTNRAAFDDQDPSEEVWSRISAQRQSKGTGWQGLFWKVAAVLLLLSTSYLIIDKNLSSSDQAINPNRQNSDFAQVEIYYSSIITNKKQELVKVADPTLRRSFLMELERLDEQYDQLKKTYHKQQASDMLTDAMINNLKIRIEILNKQLRILSEMQNLQENEKTISEI